MIPQDYITAWNGVVPWQVNVVDASSILRGQSDLSMQWNRLNSVGVRQKKTHHSAARYQLTHLKRRGWRHVAGEKSGRLRHCAAKHRVLAPAGAGPFQKL